MAIDFESTRIPVTLSADAIIDSNDKVMMLADERTIVNTAANLASLNPTLATGQFAIASDTGLRKVGPGEYNELRYVDPSGTRIFEKEGRLPFVNSDGWTTLTSTTSGTLALSGTGFWRSIWTPATANTLYGAVFSSWVTDANVGYCAFQDIRRVKFLVRLSDISSVMLFVGVMEGVASLTTMPSRGAWFRVDSSASDTNWMCVTGDGSSVNAQSSGVAAEINTSYWLEIRRASSSSWQFYIGGNSKTKGTLVATSAANLPGDANRCLPAILVVPRSAAAKRLDVGYWKVLIDFGSEY